MSSHDRFTKEELTETQRVRYWHDMNVCRWWFLQSPYAVENLRRVHTECGKLRKEGTRNGKAVYDPGEICVEDGFGVMLVNEKLRRDKDGYIELPMKWLMDTGLMAEAVATYFTWRDV